MGWNKTNLYFFSALGSLLISPLSAEDEVKTLSAPPSVQVVSENASSLTLDETVPFNERVADLPEVISENELVAAVSPPKRKTSSDANSQEGFTINYHTVSIIEYIRFASKICKTNFIYDEADLNFSITVVSDEPITPKNVMATLLQVLRIHGLTMLEQDNNLVIHQATDVKQIATLVLEDQPSGNAPIVTRIFRIQNAKADSIAAIIRPMISSSALLEVSAETRQLILTDITANVDKVATLIENLDSPHTLLDIKSFELKFNDPVSMARLTNQIMTPIAAGNPYILVPQDLTNRIFIVSTPELVDKTIEVMKQLDMSPKEKILNDRKLKAENIFVYKAMNRSGDQILKGLGQIAKSLNKAGLPDPDLMEAIANAQWIPETNSLLITASPDSLVKIKEFLSALDVATGAPEEKSSFFIYKPQYKTAEEVETALREMAKNLKGTKGSDENLIDTIDGMKINSSTHTLIFSGEEKNFAQIKNLLSTIDISSGKTQRPAVKNSFFVYKIQQAPAHDIEAALRDFAKNLEKSNVSEDGLVDAIQQMKYIKENNSLLFTGPDPALKRLQELLPNFDQGLGPQIPLNNQFFIYKPLNQKGEDLSDSIKDVTHQLKADKLADPALLRAMESMKWIKTTHSLIFTGDASSLQKIQALISTFDVGGIKPEQKSFILFQPQYASKEKTELYLKQVADNLGKRGEADLIDALHSAKWIEPSRSFMFQGSAPSLSRISELLKNFDNASQAQPVPQQRDFAMVQLNYASKEKAEEYLNQLADTLGKKPGEEDLISTIRSMKWIEPSRSYVFQGTESSLNRIKELMKNLDVPASSAQKGFTLVPLTYASKEKADQYLNQLADTLSKKPGEEDLVNSLRSMKWIDASHSYVFQGSQSSLNQIKDLFKTFDTPASAQATEQRGFTIVQLNYASKEKADEYLKQLTDTLNKKPGEEDLVAALRSMKWIEPSHSYVFQGTQNSLNQIKDLFKNFDIPSAATPTATQKNFALIPLTYASKDRADQYLNQLADTLSKKPGEDDFVTTLRSMKWIDASHSYVFQGTENSLNRVKDIFKTFDTPAAEQVRKGFFLYQPQFASKEKIEQYLDQIADNLQKKGGEDELVITIRSMKWIDASHSFMFQGHENTLSKVKDLLKDIDNSGQVLQTGFFLYQPQYASKEKVEQYLNQVADNLTKKGGDEELVTAIHSMKWIEPSRSFMFQGTEASNTRLKQLLQTFDIPSAGSVQKGFSLYQLQYAPQDKTDQYLKQVAENLSKKGGSEDLVELIQSRKWIPESHSYMFNGSEAAITQVKDLLKTFDTPESQQKQAAKPGYFIYKLQNTTGDLIEEDLDSLAKNFKSSGLSDTNIVDVIDKMRYVKETNSLLLTGDPKAIEEVKALIAQYDYPRTAAPSSKDFFMYKPQNQTADQIQKSLRDIDANLKKSGLADPNLLRAIETSKYVESTNSLVFTGSPDALQKIQLLIKEIDIAAKHVPIQHVGKSTFLLYKLKNASGPQILTSLKNITADLKKSGTADKDFLNALNSIKYVKETNSLMFTGTEEALTKVQGLVEQFDVTGLATPAAKPAPEAPVGASNFFVYKPQFVNGPDLEQILADFADNLKASGLNDPDLFSAIQSVRWIDKTQSLVFTGSTKALDQIKDLLKNFDIAANGPPAAEEGPPEGGIQTIDNMGFLVYKLQFHKGDEIQGALRQIAKDLTLSNAPINQNLLNSINSIQWLEVTNSLLCTGDQETLTRLRELIKNLDIPLKQVFIEMLVVQTTMTNALAFGLEWGSGYKYRDKFGASTFNTNPGTLTSGNTQGFATDQFTTNLAGVTPAGAAPTPSLIPASPGFDLGIIGEVIRHNGQTFLTLGSFLQALQSDNETSVLMTPKLITQDGRTSSFFQGENIPFVGSFVNNVSNSTVNTANIEYRDIGFNLTITPVLGNSDIITLDINLDSSQTITDVTQATLSNNAQTATGIVTSKTSMQTTVHVPDNNFLILSGMVNNSNAKVKSGIPCLGGLPVIGAAFSQSSDTVVNSNIVIFLRPHIINSADDMRHLTTKEEDYFRDQSGSPFLEHHYDESIELLKTVDDD